MKIKALFEGILAGLISAVLSYSALISRATFTAIAIRRKMPDAWFSGLIVWYATSIVILISIVIAEVAYRVASALDQYEALPSTRIFPGHGAPGGGKELFAQMREYLTTAKKEYLANDTAEGFVQRMRQHFPASTEMFSFITNSASSSRSRRTSGRNQPSPKDPGGIDESIDLSQDR
jgi:hypothetical protein